MSFEREAGCPLSASADFGKEKMTGCCHPEAAAPTVQSFQQPGGQKEGFASKKPTQTATTPTRDGLGASTESIVADSADACNAVFSRLQSTVLVEICARNSLFSAQVQFVSLLLDRQNAALDLYRGLGSGRQAPTG